MLRLKTFSALCLSVILVSCDFDDYYDDYYDYYDDEDRRLSDRYASGLNTVFAVVDDGSGQIYAEAQLAERTPFSSGGDDRYIELERGDSLWLSNGRASIGDINSSDQLFDQALYQSDKHREFRLANDIRDEVYFLFVWGVIFDLGNFYSVSYRRPTDEETVYTVSLVVGKEIYNSRVEMPSSFEIASPSNGASFDRRNDELEILWTNISTSVDQIQLTASTRCANGGFDEFTKLVAIDESSYVFKAGELDSEVLVGACDVALTVAKVNLGHLNPSFSDGVIQGQQVRHLNLMSEAL